MVSIDESWTNWQPDITFTFYVVVVHCIIFWQMNCVCVYIVLSS